MLLDLVCLFRYSYVHVFSFLQCRLNYFCQLSFSFPRFKHCRHCILFFSVIILRHAQLAWQYATCRMLVCVAGMYPYTIKTRNIHQYRQLSAELWRLTYRHSIPSLRYAAFLALLPAPFPVCAPASVRLYRPAYLLAVYIYPAYRSVRCVQRPS